MNKHELDDLDLNPTKLIRQWLITIDTPIGGVDQLLNALGENLPLVCGPYDNSMYLNEAGKQRFRALEGSHAGAEGTIQQTAASLVSSRSRQTRRYCPRRLTSYLRCM